MLARGGQNEESSFPEATVIYYKCCVTVHVRPIKHKESAKNTNKKISKNFNAVWKINNISVCLPRWVDQKPNGRHWRKWTLAFPLI